MDMADREKIHSAVVRCADSARYVGSGELTFERHPDGMSCSDTAECSFGVVEVEITFKLKRPQQ